jgi:hypothetical protein
MKLYSSISEKGRLIIGSCSSIENCIVKTVQRVNELGFANTVHEKGQKQAKFNFQIEENEEILTENGIDYSDGLIILEMELIVRKKEA